MTRSKNRATRRGPYRPSAAVSRGAAPPAAASSPPPSTAPTSAPAAGRPELPALGMMVASSWGWRILAVFTLVAFGLCITFFLDGHTVFGVLWFVITAGWGLFAYKLRLRHLAWAQSY